MNAARQPLPESRPPPCGRRRHRRISASVAPLAGRLASAGQVAGFLIPAVILSWAIDPLALNLRPIELASTGGAVIIAAIAPSPARTSRPLGALIIGAYSAPCRGLLLRRKQAGQLSSRKEASSLC
jgi:hypothetical protein